MAPVLSESYHIRFKLALALVVLEAKPEGTSVADFVKQLINELRPREAPVLQEAPKKQWVHPIDEEEDEEMEQLDVARHVPVQSEAIEAAQHLSSEIVNALAAVADSSSLDSSKHQAVKKLLKLLHASLSRVLQSVGAAKEQNEDELVVQAVATVALWLLSRDMVLAQEEGDVVAALVGLLTFIVEALATGPISAATPLLPSFMSHLLLTINNSQQALLNSLLPSIFRLIINWLNTLLLALSTSAPYSTRTDADRRNRVAYLIITLEELLSVIKERKEWCEEVAQGLTRIFGGEGRLELVGEVTEERVLRVLIGLWEGYEMIEESEGIVGAA